MKKPLVVLVACMLFTIAQVRAQSSLIDAADTIIHLTVGTYSYFSEPVKVSLYKKVNTIVAIYSQADTTDRLALSQDTAFKRVSDIAFKGVRNRDMDKLKEFNDLAKKYQAVFRDTVITSNDFLIAAINNAVMQSDADLERKEINKNRLVLDGFSTSFEITTQGNTRKVYAGTPTATSHPALYELIKQTFNVFRLQKRKFQPRGIIF